MKPLFSFCTAMLLSTNLYANFQDAPFDNSEAFNGCTDYSIIQSAPEFNWPKPVGFSWYKFLNPDNFWIKSSSPYHMVHDQIVTSTEPAIMEGKFDYDYIRHKDLENESVRVFVYGTGMRQWKEVEGSFITDSDGKIYVPVDVSKYRKGANLEGDYIVRMVVEADGSSADGYLSIRKPGRDTIVFDIDGTLTTADSEQFHHYRTGGEYQAQAYSYAKEMVQAYRDKGYQLIFLTARPYWQTKDTRDWLQTTLQQADWHLHTNPNAEPINLDFSSAKAFFNAFGLLGKHADFKAGYIKELKDKGFNIVRAYGNAKTDIEAYERELPEISEAYIIGKYADEAVNRGMNNTGADYTYHYSTVVIDDLKTPYASCKMKN